MHRVMAYLGGPPGAESRRSRPTRIELSDDEGDYLPRIRFFERFKPTNIA